MKTRLAALALAFSATLASAQDMPSSAPLFAATLNDLDEKPVALERYKGKPLIVNFWARWCGPCRVEIPELIAIRRAYKGKLEVLGIGIEDKADAAKEFARAYEMDYPVFVAGANGIPLMQALGNAKGGLPFTIVVDRNGQVVQKKMGIMRKADLEAAAELAHKGR